MKENKMGAEFLGGADQHLFKKIRGPAKREEVRTGEKIDKPEEIIKVFLDRYAQVLQREDEQKRERGVEAIWRMVKRNHIIKEENISKAFNNHLKIERDRGKDISWGEDITKSEIPRLKKEYAERVIGDQEDSLYNWIEYFASQETDTYPLWFKFLALKNVLRVGEYKVNEKQFYKRTKYTAEPFMPLNEEALGDVYKHFNRMVEGKEIETNDEEIKESLEKKSFLRTYFRRMEILKRKRGAEHLEVIDGEWRRFTKGQEEELFDSLRGYYTGWRLKDSNEQRHRYLGDGDVFIYYSNNKKGDPAIPRLTIAFDGERIKEISGIGKYQKVDKYILPVLKEKLEEYPQEAERYNKAAEYMKRVTEIHNSPLSISKEDLRFLYEIDGKIHNFLGGEEMIEEILRGRDKIEDVAYIFGVPKDQISTSEEEALSGKCVYHLGNLLIEDKELAELKRNGGTKFPIVVGGEYIIILSTTNIKDIPPLPEGVENLELNGLTNPEGLNIPEGVWSLSLNGLTNPEGLNIPEGVQHLHLNGLTNPEGLNIPEGVLELDFNGLKTAEGLKIPKGVMALFLNGLTNPEGLNIPEGMKILSLDGLTNPEGLKIPKGVRGLSLNGLTNPERLNIPEGVRWLYLNGLTNPEGLNIPEGVEELYLNGLKTAEGLKIPEGVKHLELNGLTNPEGLNIPEGVKHLELNGLTNPEGLNIPGGVKILSLNGLTNPEGLKMPESVKRLSLNGLKTAEGLKIPESVWWLELKGLTNAEEFPPPRRPYNLERLVVSRNMSDEEFNKLERQYPNIHIHRLEK